MLSIGQVVSSTLIACTRELFSSYEVELTQANSLIPQAEPGQLVATIAYSGDHIRGSLGVALDNELLRFVTEKTGAPLDHDAIVDVLAENANQLLGRLKNRLRHHAITLAVSLPKVRRGAPPPRADDTPDVWRHRFSTPKGGLTVWLDAQPAEGVTFAEPVAEITGEGLLEGELVLF
jgi:hypothetical protein